MPIRRIVPLSALLFAAVGAAFFALPRNASQRESAPNFSVPQAPITRLTNDPANALRPAWSPDNRLIAFESNRAGTFQIHVMEVDGSNQRALTTGPNENRRPVWTPDGQSILYDSFDGAHQDIWSVNVANGKKRQLTRVEGLADFGTLSPDGMQIVFYLYKDMTLNLWTARADGSEAKPLTHDFADALRSEPTISWHEAGWSSDSQWLTFAGGDGKSICVMRRDGSEMRTIVEDDETSHFPWFMADGRVAFITEYVPPLYGGAWTNAWIYDLESGKRTLMQEFMSMQGPVDWNADYSLVLFSSPRAGNFDIYLVNLNVPGGLQALQGKAVAAAE